MGEIILVTTEDDNTERQSIWLYATWVTGGVGHDVMENGWWV